MHIIKNNQTIWTRPH